MPCLFVDFISSYVHVTRELFTVGFRYIFCISTMEPSICLYLPRWSTTTSTRQCFRPESHGYRHEWPPRDLHPGLWHFWYCALLIQPIPLGLNTYLLCWREWGFKKEKGGKQNSNEMATGFYEWLVFESMGFLDFLWSKYSWDWL